MPSVRVKLSRSLLAFWSGSPAVDVEGDTLAAALAALDERAPGMTARIVDEQGRLRRHVLVFVNEEAVTEPPDAVTLSAGDVVHVLPAVSGGS